eukprot:TRINITY_DN16000_c0_g1_i3.p1 TRINITY_DN16000_c0_g1~~TRINITY_DN16000_c0_g1_i3.p1  ORF type:complete len:219 (-),score=44.47 TRINITY_DN16000_c0_g1_i3:217-873(-)
MENATTLYLRHGAQLSTDPPAMNVISREEMAHAMDLHARTQYFHSDFAHTDFRTSSPDVLGAASWSSAPLPAPARIPSSIIAVMLWVGTSAVEAEFTVSLSHHGAQGWSSLCGATANTVHREGPEERLPLPGKDMMAASANGGFAVGLPLQMELEYEVELQPGDILRLDVSCGGAEDGPVDQRVWHNHKWGSTVQLALDPPSELEFVPHPEIQQPEEA